MQLGLLAKRYYPQLMVAAGGLMCIAGIGFGRFAYPVILPNMKKALSLSYTEAGLVLTGGVFGSLLGSVLAGMIVARWGLRWTVSITLFLAGLAFMATGAIPSVSTIIVVQTVGGMLLAVAVVGAFAIPVLWIEPKRRGVANGVMTSLVGVGMTVSTPALQYILSSHPDAWRTAWYAVGMTIIVIGAIVLVFVRNTPKDVGLSPEWTSNIRASGPESPFKFGYTSPLVWHLVAIYFVWAVGFSMEYSFFVSYIAEAAGHGLGNAAAVWAFVGAVGIISGFACGFLSDVVGRRLGLFLILTTMAVSALGAAMFQQLAAFYIFGFLLGMVFNAVPPVIAAAGGDYFGPKGVTGLVGLCFGFGGLGQAVGPYVAGAIADYTASFTMVYVVSGIILVVAAFIALGLRDASARARLRSAAKV